MRLTTVNPLHGRTWNPWHPDASPGGSSGGAGVAAAVGFGAIHHGNDIAGSLRFPAFANGVVTLKPTQGRIPAFNPSATVERSLHSQLTSVQGAIARSVADVRLATRVMAGGDVRDPWWVPAPFDGEPLPQPVRVAVTRNSHGYPIHPGILELIDRSADYLRDAGYEVVEAEPPSIMDPARGWLSVLLTEIKATLGPTVDQHGSDDLRQIFAWYYEMGTILDYEGVRTGLAEKTRMARSLERVSGFLSVGADPVPHAPGLFVELRRAGIRANERPVGLCGLQLRHQLSWAAGWIRARRPGGKSACRGSDCRAALSGGHGPGRNGCDRAAGRSPG